MFNSAYSAEVVWMVCASAAILRKRGRRTPPSFPLPHAGSMPDRRSIAAAQIKSPSGKALFQHSAASTAFVDFYICALNFGKNLVGQRQRIGATVSVYQNGQFIWCAPAPWLTNAIALFWSAMPLHHFGAVSASALP